MVDGRDNVVAGCELEVAPGEIIELGLCIETTGGIFLVLSPPDTNTFGLFFKGGLLAFVMVTNGPLFESG